MILYKAVLFFVALIVILAVTLGFIPLYLDEEDQRFPIAEINVTKGDQEENRLLKLVGEDVMDDSLKKLVKLTDRPSFRRVADIRVANAFTINNTHVYDILNKRQRMTREDKAEIENYKSKVRDKVMLFDCEFVERIQGFELKVERLLKRKKRWDNFRLKKRDTGGVFSVSEVAFAVYEKLINTSYVIIKELIPEDDCSQLEKDMSLKFNDRNMYSKLYIDETSWVKWSQPIIKVVENIPKMLSFVTTAAKTPKQTSLRTESTTKKTSKTISIKNRTASTMKTISETISITNRTALTTKTTSEIIATTGSTTTNRPSQIFSTAKPTNLEDYTSGTITTNALTLESTPKTNLSLSFNISLDLGNSGNASIPFEREQMMPIDVAHDDMVADQPQPLIPFPPLIFVTESIQYVQQNDVVINTGQVFV